MSKTIQSIRGMHDISPDDSASWSGVESRLKQVLQSFGYRECRTPIVESLDLFKRSVGEVTDIVEKEMYAFEDRNGESLALRPEGTASVVRAGIQGGWIRNQQQRLWYIGPFFRHERPQKGRYRQFHQLGVETFGFDGPDIDAELIMIAAQMWQRMGIASEDVELQLNTLGSLSSRARYRQALSEYLRDHIESLDDEAKRRLDTNPLRILDSKKSETQDVVRGAPSLMDYIDDESREHFEGLQSRLRACDIGYTVNPRLVRGLDYYSKTVFEWTTTRLGAQGTICAGGRYDGLVEQLGGAAASAAGFAIGLERILALLEDQAVFKDQVPLAYVISVGDDAELVAFQLINRIRSHLPDISVIMNCGGGSFKAQMKRANRASARLALILGEDEVREQQVSVKYLQEDKQQHTVQQSQLLELLAQQQSLSE